MRKMIQEWVKGWQKHRYNEKESVSVFSPMTYKNPCISQIVPILEYILEKRQLFYQQLEMIVIDVEMPQDNYDIQSALSRLSDRLNYLLLINDRPAYFKNFTDTVFEENGLIIQQVSKSDTRRARGNLILDFERSLDTAGDSITCPGVIYIPIYKKPWEISENLDITVPVGYNTLVVEGIDLPYKEEDHAVYSAFEDDLDRLEREFRKG